jgi:PKD repeat protein
MKTKLLVSLFLVLGLFVGLVSFVSAEPNTGIILYLPSDSGSACIGHDITYDVRITNDTLVSQIFTLTYTSEWSYVAPPATSSISAGDHWDFQVIVHVPWSANPGDFDELTLRASGGGFTATAEITTTAAAIRDWVDKANTPSSVRWPSVVYYDGRLYRIGGYYNSIAQPWLYIYDIGTDTWSQGADLPAGRTYIDCEAIAGKIYCAGGLLSGDTYSTLYIYDIGENTWDTGAPMPTGTGRYAYASAAFDGFYFIIGGSQYGGNYLSSMMVYDPSSDTWDTTRASMNTTRRYHSVGVINGKIYVAGGYNGAYLSSAEVYDPDADDWTSIASMPLPRVNAADGVNLDRYLIMAGGSSNALGSGSTEALFYDEVFDAWHWLPNMDHSLYAAEGDSDGTNFWITAGQTMIGDVSIESPYTTLMDICDATCANPVTGVDFTWNPTGPWTGYPVTFTATTESGAPVIDFAWVFADGATGTGQAVEHTFASALTYEVEVTASNCDETGISTISHEILVIDPPTIDTAPLSMEAIQLQDMNTTQQLELCNDGDYPLNWTLTEAPQNFDWLLESSTTGSISADTCINVDITFDSIGLDYGDYSGSLNITSNDPVNPQVTIPITLTVAPPAVELVKTVGLEENTCGTSNDIVVYPDTTVYYCYTVTNIGGTSFNLHSLNDDQLGDLPIDTNLILDPGESYYYISDPVIITDTTTNTATWIANLDLLSATGSDTATVTVIPEPDCWIYLPAVFKLPAR